MPDQKTPPKTPAAIAVAVLLAVPLTSAFEGLRTHPYHDPGNPQLMTVCYGETERAMRTYTPQECADLLKQRQTADYAPAVLKCVPNFAYPYRRYAFAASVDAAYNAGIAAFCRSPMAKVFNTSPWWEPGCDAFSGWYVTAKGKRLPGLVKRREAERELCLRSS